jgi:glyoxylase-like metal-dependent hydrolase (beta-lactamase superfamily II)
MPNVHRIESRVAELPVNAYLIEGERELVAVDGTLTVSGGRAVRARIDEIGKPLAALVVTHAHPDHYGGVVEVIRRLDAPIVATAGVDEAIRSIDAGREKILRPMFGDEWPTERVFPTRRVVDGEVLGFGDIELRVQDLGPGESLHDSVWLLDGNHSDVFTGDQGYNRMHSFLADGHWDRWLATSSGCGESSPPRRFSTSATADRRVLTCSTGSAPTSRRPWRQYGAPTGLTPRRQRPRWHPPWTRGSRAPSCAS